MGKERGRRGKGHMKRGRKEGQKEVMCEDGRKKGRTVERKRMK
jgi:hypothetical protein